MFLPKRGLLGLVLASGTFVVLKNTMALEVELIAAFSISATPTVLFEKLPPRTYPPHEIQQALGLDNLCIAGGKITFLGQNSVDVVERQIPLDGQLL